MIQGNVKLTRADGSSMLIEPHIIEIVEAIAVAEIPAAKSGVWLSLQEGFVSSDLLGDSFGWLLQKVSPMRPRLQLTSIHGGKTSIPIDIIKRVVEAPTMTIIHTSLTLSDGKPVRVGVQEKVDEIMDLAGVNGEGEVVPEPLPVPVETEKKVRRRAKAEAVAG